MRRTILVVLVVGAAFSDARATTASQTFEIDCEPPFAKHLELMTEANDECPVTGKSEGPAHAAQNAAKSNLCAEGDPVEATFATFRRLETAIVKHEIDNWSPRKLPPDRTIFHNLITTTNGDVIGEGSVVKLVAYVAKVKRGGEEYVNCKLAKSAFMDLHVVLVPYPDATGCKSVIATVIPYLRPVVWDAAAMTTPNVPMRFTGQLFLDAGRKVCRYGKPSRGQLARFSSWEIHPVYAIEVCEFATTSRCKADDETVWTPLSEWKKPEEAADTTREAVASTPQAAAATPGEPEESAPTAAPSSQETLVRQLAALEEIIERQAGTLPVRREKSPPWQMDGYDVTGVPHQDAVAWVRRAEADIGQRVASQEWRGLDVADFVRRELDVKIHESRMPVDHGLVSQSTIGHYVATFREILRRARMDEQFRVTFEVKTQPTGATFQLCREYVPTDCTAVGTNVRFDRIYRGKYVYTITMGGYHPVSSIPLNLVNFTQSVLNCPLRKLTDGAGPVPCTPQ